MEILMEKWSEIVALIAQNQVNCIASLFAAVIILLLLVVILFGRNRRLKERLAKYDLVRSENTKWQGADLDDLSVGMERLEKKVSLSLQRVGLVRFNAFDDISSDLSFSLAVLDEHGDGFLISSLFGRNETRTFGKPVEAGKSKYQLSSEEVAAIKRAMEM